MLIFMVCCLPTLRVAHAYLCCLYWHWYPGRIIDAHEHEALGGPGAELTNQGASNKFENLKYEFVRTRAYIHVYSGYIPGTATRTAAYSCVV